MTTTTTIRCLVTVVRDAGRDRDRPAVQSDRAATASQPVDVRLPTAHAADSVVGLGLRGPSARQPNVAWSLCTATGCSTAPLHGDCRLRWLRRFVDAGGRPSINWNFAAHNTPVCTGPELLRGVSWRHLAADQFACPPSQVVGNGTTSVELAVGANASIACVVDGDPPPVVTWMRASRQVPAGMVDERTEAGENEPPRLRSVLRLTGVTHQVRLKYARKPTGISFS